MTVHFSRLRIDTVARKMGGKSWREIATKVSKDLHCAVRAAKRTYHLSVYPELLLSFECEAPLCLSVVAVGCAIGNLQAGGEYDDKDEDFRRSPYKDKDTEDIRRYS
ncbi:hypothetical protein Tco_0085210 [Tanacetum coccineum]